jgi:glycosyltransferase involved in cell wall biosynthesis
MNVPLEVPIDQEGVETYVYPVQLSVWGNEVSFPMARALKRRVPQSDIVLIHSLYQFTSTAASYYCRKKQVPYVLRPHGTLDPFLVYRRRWPLKWAYINLFEKNNFNAAAAIQYSSRMEESMTSHFMDVTSPSLVIPEGIDLEKFAKLPPRGTFRAKHPETAGKVLILFLGRFHQKKGLELLIDAIARPKSRGDAHLVLAGSGDPDYVTQISQMVRGAGLSRCTTITGQLSEEDKLAALADADLFVLPSFGENFGLAVVEAMACGVPVLISDKVGIWPEIAEAEAGMVTPCDVDKIADAINKLVNDQELRAILGGRGRKLVHEQFSMDRMAERMELAYQSLCRTAQCGEGTRDN